MIRSVRGMHDVLPDESAALRRIESVLIETLDTHGYREIRLPVLERSELFSRSLGEVTDIVEKEMYTFEDRGGDLLSLRPEGTAGCARAGLEHGLLRPDCRQRLWYSGVFFRRERPQKGRYRQFHQIGAEAFGFAGPDVDAELIAMTKLMWERLGITGKVTLKINSLGDADSRRCYRKELIDYLVRHEDRLDENVRRRIQHNPLRVLDSKDENTRAVVANAPRLSDHLDRESAHHYAELKELLTVGGVEFEEDDYLVRGLDYYTRTVFEWVIAGSTAQSAVCAGGRYDGLVEALGGGAVPAAGFALGLERLSHLVAPADSAAQAPDAYIIAVGDPAQRVAHQLSAELHRSLPHCRIVVNCGAGSFKAQLKRADRSGAKVALIIGDDEVEAELVGCKPLRGEGRQIQLSVKQLGEHLRRHGL